MNSDFKEMIKLFNDNIIFNGAAHFTNKEFRSEGKLKFPDTYDVETAKRALEILRFAWNMHLGSFAHEHRLVITPNNGYRSPEYNAKLRLQYRPDSPHYPVHDTQHEIGTAVDLVPDFENNNGVSGVLLFDLKVQALKELAAIVMDLQEMGIFPLGGLGVYKTHLHIDFRGMNITWNK